MHLDELLARNGIKFGIYKNGHFREQLFPFEAIPRIITKDDVAYLQAGLIQRVNALNAFLKDAYNDYSIVKDGNILEGFCFLFQRVSTSAYRYSSTWRHLCPHSRYRSCSEKRRQLVCTGR